MSDDKPLTEADLEYSYVPRYVRSVSYDVLPFPFLQLRRLFLSIDLGTGLLVKAVRRAGERN